MHAIKPERRTVLALVYSLPPFETGGAESQALKLSKELASLNVDTIFITIGNRQFRGWGDCQGFRTYRVYNVWDRLKTVVKSVSKKEQPSITKIEYDDASEKTSEVTTPITFSTRMRYLSLFASSFFLLLRQRELIDIIYVPSLEWSAIVGVWLAKIFRKPLVVKDSTMNGITNVLRYPNGKGKQQALATTAHFVAISRAIVNNLQKQNVPAGSITYIPNGINVSAKLERTNVPASGTKRVLFIGNLTQQPAKGVDILLKAWKAVQLKKHNIHLDIVGKGDLEAYRTYCVDQQIEGVTFHGRQSNVNAFFQSACLFVLPSRREGLANALLEAMLHGLPCVATNISGSQDAISSGENGLLVPPGDANRLAEAITFLLENPEQANAMGMKARSAVVANYDLHLIGRKYRTLYDKLLTEKLF